MAATAPVSGQDDGYDSLRAAVTQLLPADASGARRPPDRDALRVYWQLGGLLNEFLQGRAAYGQRTMSKLAAELNFLPRTLYRARRVHQYLPPDLPAGLSWSHCRLLVTVEDDDTRHRLLQRVTNAGWTVRRLQEHLQIQAQAPPVPLAPRLGSCRIVTGINSRGDKEPCFDLGFGMRRPLVLSAKPGKRTRRLMRELVAGDAVEITEDDKGRPALHRLWGQVEQRLYVYRVLHLEAVGAAVLKAQLDLGFDVQCQVRLRLQPPAYRLSRTVLAAAVASTTGSLLARTVRGKSREYCVDLYRYDATETAEHLNTSWVATGSE